MCELYFAILSNLLRKLSLSTNAIEKISNLSGLRKRNVVDDKPFLFVLSIAYILLERLKTLSIGRNNLKKLEQLEPVADTLEQLWCSYNNVEKLNGVQV